MSSEDSIDELTFTVSGHISKPVDLVYEAVADPEQLSKYFTTGGAQGRMETGAEVSWDFHDFPGAFPVQVINAQRPHRLEFTWAGNHTVDNSRLNRVLFEFSSVDAGARTKVSISEFSWQPTKAGASAAFDNCEGWASMLAAMKAWMEYGINLREGFYK
ncbi:SRPBCC domain-containing protein [Glutamicibacter uratoxydans]|uniref:SRPBCC domain-containing protein n=1 Tax=Glutamicibacter uratoxydans TaxID=43667 RepID=UPI003D6F3BD8